MKKDKREPIKTVLTISIGFLVIYLITKMKWVINVALIVGLIGIFSTYLSKQVDFLWMKLTHLLSLIVPNILLGTIFYLFLFPISVLSKLFRKNDPMKLQNKYNSTFVAVDKSFDKNSFERPW